MIISAGVLAMGCLAKRSSWSLCLALAALCAGCAGGGGGGPGPVDDNDAGESCIDADGDGFGEGCLAGPDCDDNDPQRAFLCPRCAEIPYDHGCPCELEPQMECLPPPIPTAGGVFRCREGVRSCRDNFWTACEPIGEGYVFVPF